MFRIRSIRGKITSAMVVFCMLSVVAAGAVSVFTMRRAMTAELEQKTRSALVNVGALLEKYKREALAQASNIALSPALRDGIKSGDFQTLLSVMKPLLESGQLGYMVATDITGRALCRPHEPDKIPAPDDSIINQINIQHAVAGKFFAGIEQGKYVRLSVRAGAPVRDTDGSVIGALSAGYVASQKSVVEEAKVLAGGEVSLRTCWR